MSGFDDIKIGWKEETFSVPADRCMGLLAALEEVLAPGQGQSVIDLLAQPHKAHMTKLAKAYGVALRYAGAAVTDQAVYLSLSREMQKGGTEGYLALRTLADGLLAMFFPEWSQVELGNEQGEGEADQTAASTPNQTHLAKAS